MAPVATEYTAEGWDFQKPVWTFRKSCKRIFSGCPTTKKNLHVTNVTETEIKLVKDVRNAQEILEKISLGQQPLMWDNVNSDVTQNM